MPDPNRNCAGYRDRNDGFGKPARLPGRDAGPHQRFNRRRRQPFHPKLVADILAIPDNAGGQIRLVDIDPDRLATMRRLIGALIGQAGAGIKWDLQGRHRPV